MALITLDKAATRMGISPETIEAWAEQGLLTLHRSPDLSKLPPNTMGLLTMQQLVEEDELYHVVESVGWLRLSAEGWDEVED